MSLDHKIKLGNEEFLIYNSKLFILKFESNKYKLSNKKENNKGILRLKH